MSAQKLLAPPDGAPYFDFVERFGEVPSASQRIVSCPDCGLCVGHGALCGVLARLCSTDGAEYKRAIDESRYGLRLCFDFKRYVGRGGIECGHVLQRDANGTIHLAMSTGIMSVEPEFYRLLSEPLEERRQEGEA